MIFQGLKQKRDHIGRKDKYSWLKEECLAEVRGYEQLMSSTTQS